MNFVLKRPQPAFIALLASGMSPVYPCHVSPAQMRQQPIGTGPFKFAEFRPNEFIKVVKNPDYWKPGLPYTASGHFQKGPRLRGLGRADAVAALQWRQAKTRCDLENGRADAAAPADH